MIRRTTWIFLAIFVGLLGLAWYLQSSKEKAAALATPTPGAENLVDIQESSIKTLKIEGDQGKVVILGRDDKGLWALTEPKAEATDIAQAESAVSQLVSLKVLSTVDPPPSSDVTGLNPAAATISVELNDGSNKTVRIGKLTPIQNGYYTQVDGGPLVVVSKYGIEAVLKMLTEPPIATPTAVPTATPEEMVTPQP